MKTDYNILQSEPRLFNFKDPRIRVLHFTWFAFFLTFVVWFNMAPVLTKMIETVEWLTKDNIKSILICNVALTIPARIIVGKLIDKYGPRIVYGWLMILTTIPGLFFAFGDSLVQLIVSRLLLSSIGAGFVIGIKMTANWFPPKYVGRAEGLYAGWGNFGSAAAAAIVPVIGIDLLGGDDGWRWALAITSVLCGLYGVVYLFMVKDHPDGYKPVQKPKTDSLIVSSKGELIQYVLWQLPMYVALGLLTYNLSKQKVMEVPIISENVRNFIWIALGIFFLYDAYKIVKVNLAHMDSVAKWDFGSVGALNTTYFANFGAELAVVSMLPMFFETTFRTLVNDAGEPIVTKTLAGIIASSFAFVNLFARPLGGYLSDKLGNRKRTMVFYMLGIAVGFFAMANIAKYGPVNEAGEQTLLPMVNSVWWLVVSVVITVACSFFVQGAEGATFAIIPCIKKEYTGKISGMAGAYGNVGAVVYLFLFSFVDAKTFLYILSAGAFLSTVYCIFFLKEPEGSFAETMEQDTIMPKKKEVMEVA